MVPFAIGDKYPEEKQGFSYLIKSNFNTYFVHFSLLVFVFLLFLLIDSVNIVPVYSSNIPILFP